MKYLNSRVWRLRDHVMLIYLRVGNKRGIYRMTALVSEEYHYCLRCSYNSACNACCNIVCYNLENMSKLKEKIKEEFGIIEPRITPLKIERLRRRFCTTDLLYIFQNS